MRSRTRTAWRRTLRGLRLECPPALPVRVRLEEGPRRWFGETGLSRDRRSILITVFRRVQEAGARHDRAVTRSELVETLIHEWAHALAWRGDAGEPHFEHHDAAWGVAYAACYRAVVED